MTFEVTTATPIKRLKVHCHSEKLEKVTTATPIKRGLKVHCKAIAK